VEEFINTRSAESGTDEIATAALLGNWLRDRYLLRAGVPVTTDEHHRVMSTIGLSACSKGCGHSSR
jgi:hypothetical protein